MTSACRKVGKGTTQTRQRLTIRVQPTFCDGASSLTTIEPTPFRHSSEADASKEAYCTMSVSDAADHLIARNNNRDYAIVCMMGIRSWAIPSVPFVLRIGCSPWP